MPDERNPEKPLEIDFGTSPDPGAKLPAAKPLDLDWFEATPAKTDVLPPAPLLELVSEPPTVPLARRPTVPLESLPAAVVVAPKAARSSFVPPRQVQVNEAPASRAEKPARPNALKALLIIGLLFAGTIVAVLVLMYAIYEGFKTAGKPKSATTVATGRR